MKFRGSLFLGQISVESFPGIRYSVNGLVFANRNATREQVMEAAKAACCDEFNNNLEEGYDTILGENGGTLSGGERL